MALHRDIFWVGRQWAVTGHGLQAVDQKQKSKFDIAISRLWDDDLLDGLSAERWFNLEDFNQGLALARARYPEPPRKAKPPPDPTKSAATPDARPKALLRAAQPIPRERIKLSRPLPREPEAAAPRGDVPPLKQSVAVPRSEPRSQPLTPLPPVEVLEPVIAEFAMRLEGCGGAKFMPMWRIRIRR